MSEFSRLYSARRIHKRYYYNPDSSSASVWRSWVSRTVPGEGKNASASLEAPTIVHCELGGAQARHRHILGTRTTPPLVSGGRQGKAWKASIRVRLKNGLKQQQAKGRRQGPAASLPTLSSRSACAAVSVQNRRSLASTDVLSVAALGRARPTR